MLRHFLNPPNWFTAASLLCSVYAMTLLLGRVPDRAALATACALVVLGGVFDTLDGRVARWLRRFSDFGAQLDSVADMLGFGVAPAAIAWVWKLHELGALGVGVTVWFVIAAAFRLARFNVGVVRAKRPLPGHGQGLTSTMAGGMLVTSGWLAHGYLYPSLDPSPEAVALFVAALGYLMVSGIPFRDFKDARSSRPAQVILVVGLTPSVIAGLFHPALFFGVGGALYLLLCLPDGLVTGARHGLLVNGVLLREWPSERDEAPAA